MELLNCWFSFQRYESYAPHTQSLYKFCRDNSYFHYSNWSYLRLVKLSVEEIRDSFQYIREHNYELFKKLYEWDEVKYKGGKIINEWS